VTTCDELSLPLVRARSAEAAAERMSHVTAVNLPDRRADRTADEELFAKLGLLEAQPQRQHVSALNPAAAAALSWHLRHGPLFMRVNAAVVLRQHAAHSVAPHERCLLATGVLSALARGA
jgi:hypothetical protein